jgi:DNA-binding NtrC family response regulator
MTVPIRILLVDDEVGFLESITRVLTRRGISVHTACEGAAALRSLSQEQFDVVVLDVRMPVMDGIEVFSEMRKSDPVTPVIFLSGQSDLGCIAESLKKGAADYLLKPCDVESLVSAIENAHERKKISLEIMREKGKK